MSAEADVKLEDFSSIFSLDQKVAVVTGGSRGLGLHAASGWVAMCYTVVDSLSDRVTCIQSAPSRMFQSLHLVP
jgi:hypothetical protein